MIRVRSQKNQQRRLFSSGKRLASILFSFNLGRDGKTCLCEALSCNDTSVCADDSFKCFSAVRRLQNGSKEIEKGLIDCWIN